MIGLFFVFYRTEGGGLRESTLADSVMFGSQWQWIDGWDEMGRAGCGESDIHAPMRCVEGILFRILLFLVLYIESVNIYKTSAEKQVQSTAFISSVRRLCRVCPMRRSAK